MVVHLYFDYAGTASFLAWKRLAGRPGIAWKPVPGAPGESTLASQAHLVAAAAGLEEEWMRRAFGYRWVEGKPLDGAALGRLGTALGIPDFPARLFGDAARLESEGIRLEASLHKITVLPAALVDGAVVTGAGLHGL